MPVTPTFPGIYIQELPSTSHTVTAAPTNIAVFIGYTHPLKTNPANFNKAVQIFGFTEYQRQFGGFLRSRAYALAGTSQWVGRDGATHFADPTTAPETSFGDMAVAVNQFLLNGGTTAYIIALPPPNVLSQGATIQLPEPRIIFTAREITDDNFVMTLTVRPVPPAGNASPPLPDLVADVIITYGPAPGPQPGVQAPPGTITETYRRVTLTRNEGGGVGPAPDPNFIETRIGTTTSPVSSLVTVQVTDGGSFTTSPASFTDVFPPTFSTSPPSDTVIFNATDFTNVMQEGTDLDKLQIFNLMVIPGVTNSFVLSTALAFCEAKRAFLIVDPPITDSVDGTLPHFTRRIQDTIKGNNPPVTIPAGKNAALYFPYLLSPDPLTGQPTNSVTGRVNEIPPSATVAGVFAATDLSRGVWKAPAGFQAMTNNTTGVVERGRMTDQQQGLLNPIGVDCLRVFPNIANPVVFGARTLVTLTDEQWRYVPVRRMALFLEQTFYANLGWVVFEPNDEPLWAAIRMSLNAFMLGLFRQGAFQGTTPSQAFKVSCDSQTTTQADIDNGIVNIVVAFAPLKPAEFVIITISQLAGQTQTS
jgi:hypothetical protein